MQEAIVNKGKIHVCCIHAEGQEKNGCPCYIYSDDIKNWGNEAQKELDIFFL
jgi:hypothetical protein